MFKEVWLIVGEVTDETLYEGAVLGQPEYQFSDGPEETRTMSNDYIDLMQGVQDYAGYVIHTA